MLNASLILIVVAWSLTATATTTISPFIAVCHRSDPQLNDCIRQFVDSLKVRLPHGIEELFIPPLDPLLIREIKFEQNSPTIFLHSTYNDVYIHGLSDYSVKNLKIDPNNFEFEATLNFPAIEIKAKYSMDGKIMVLPLKGNGDMEANLTDINVDVITKCTSFVKDDRRFLKIDDFQIIYEVNGSKLHLDNLFKGDRELGDRMNAFLNENWKVLSEEIRPILTKSIADVVRSSVDKFLETYSFDQFLPE